MNLTVDVMLFAAPQIAAVNAGVPLEQQMAENAAAIGDSKPTVPNVEAPGAI